MIKLVINELNYIFINVVSHEQLLYYKISKIWLNGSHAISDIGIYSSMLYIGDVNAYCVAFR